MENKEKTWADCEVIIVECPDALLHGIDNREFSITLDGGAVKPEQFLPLLPSEEIKSKGKGDEKQK